MILSTLRPYELANEPFLHDLILNAMEVGARLSRERVRRLQLDDDNKLISGDGVRKNLDRVYDNTKAY